MMPGLRERLEGCERVAKVRTAIDTTSYFRRSSGPGWALAGDSGHFKDPVTAQGIRDALRFGRLLGEVTAPASRTRGPWTARSRPGSAGASRECLETYEWTNRLGRAAEMSPIEIELYRAAAADPDLARRVLDVFSRSVRPARAIPARLGAQMALRALRRDGADRERTVVELTCELRSAGVRALVRAAAPGLAWRRRRPRLHPADDAVRAEPALAPAVQRQHDTPRQAHEHAHPGLREVEAVGL